MGEDQIDRRKARRILVGMLVLGVTWLVAAYLLFLDVSPFLGEIGLGVGLRDGAVYAFFLSSTLMIVFAVFAGDGLLGEVQYMIMGFFVLFAISWPAIVLLF